ncbi:glycosyltransferase [Paenibacillus medicaginis]|uniref:Glycosyltransferase n=1 Tax=Paenibacillus medicaginis TaxID=1470560 RepID=A0ABV5CCR7_9BACL
MEEPSISLCMIVKNEEEYLPKCLGSVQGVVDEIIIVDTGSTDATIAIARAYGAKVIPMPWQDSFADARNRGFEEATGDWILWLDADEEMDVDEAGKLKELLNREAIREQKIEGIQLVFCHHVEGGGTEEVQLLRMVRNRPQYRFEGRIHEQILPGMLKCNPGLQLGQVDIHVHHYGYLLKNIIAQDKKRRNRTLLQQVMAESPENPEYFYYWGVELLRMNDLEEALGSMEVFLKRAPSNIGKGILTSAHKYRLMVLKDLGRYHDLIRDSKESIALFPRFTDLYHLKAIGYSSLGEIDEAIHSLHGALSIGPAESEYQSIAGCGTYLTCLDLGRLYHLTGNPKEADFYFTVASLMVGHPGIRFQRQPDLSGLVFQG